MCRITPWIGEIGDPDWPIDPLPIGMSQVWENGGSIGCGETCTAMPQPTRSSLDIQERKSESSQRHSGSYTTEVAGATSTSRFLLTFVVMLLDCSCFNYRNSHHGFTLKTSHLWTGL